MTEMIDWPDSAIFVVCLTQADPEIRTARANFTMEDAVKDALERVLEAIGANEPCCGGCSGAPAGAWPKRRRAGSGPSPWRW